MKLAAAMLLAAGTTVSAQSLSTGFTGNVVVSNTEPDNGNMIDVTSYTSGGLTINSFDIHSNAFAGTPITVDLYYKQGTHIGATGAAASWTLLGTFNVNAAGALTGTPLALTTGFVIPAYETYAFYFNIREVGASIRYFALDQRPATNIANDDLGIMVRQGTANSGLFGTTTFFPRGWNGTIHYTPAGIAGTGACCLPTASCDIRTQGSCVALGGSYQGDNTTCGPCIHFEEEMNNNKDDANAFVLMHGDSVRGVSTGTTTTAGSGLPTTVDYYLLQTPPAPLGIYEHRMILSSSTPFNSAWIRGLTQTGAPAGTWPGPVGTATTTESTGQSHNPSGTDRVNIWYGFGKEERVYYRVSGTTSATGEYTATLQTTPVTPVDIGTFQAGIIDITTTGQGHTNDTHLRIWDASLNPIEGYANDGASINGGAPANLTTTSFLRREYAAGTYYMGIALTNLATDQGAACDDNVRTGPMMDFPNVAVDTGTVTVTDVSFAITDAAGTMAFPASRGGRGEMAWFRFTVTGSIVMGACCFPSGACEVLSAPICLAQGGNYQGDNTNCTVNPCPQPPTGACCIASGCIIVWSGGCIEQGGIYNGDNTTCAAGLCDSYRFEVEPNNTKAQANEIVLLSGQTLVGSATAASGTGDPASPDYFLIKTPAAPLGIYRHRMSLTNATTVGNSSWIRGLTQTGAAAGPWPGPVGTATSTEATGQAHWLDGTDRTNIWYGFGRQEQVYYRISGVASTTGQYLATLDTAPVVPTDLGAFQAGVIIINTADQGHNNDTHVRIWDGNFEPVHGFANDGASMDGYAPGNSTTTSFLLREYQPGTYYIGIAMGNLATNQGSPCDDNVRTGVMMDFADVAVDTGTQTVTDVSFSIIDSGGVTPFAASRGGRGEIAWFRFTVTGTPVTGACCFGSGACEVLAPALCTIQGGTYQGNGTDCTVNPCPQPGACCVPNGCAIHQEAMCLAVGGTFRGQGTTCPANCTPPDVGNLIGFNFTTTSAPVTDVPNWNRITGPTVGSFSNALDDTGAPTTVGLAWGMLGAHSAFLYNASVAANATPQHTYDLMGMRGYTYRLSAEPMTMVLSGLTPGATYEYWFVAYRASLAMANIVRVSSGDTLNVITFPQMLPSTANDYRFLINEVNADNTMQFNDLALSTVASSSGTITFNWQATGSEATTIGALAIREVLSTQPCYANCDNSTTPPILNVEDFSCFINEFAAGSVLPHEQQLTHYSNCDQSTTAPVLNVEDFSCFINKFAQGCD
jgi:hypothetical protein